MLREEVLELKNEVLRHAGCGFWAVDEYLTRCAGDLLGVDPSNRTPSMRPRITPMDSTSAESADSDGLRRPSSSESVFTVGSSPDDNGYSGLDFLQDIDEEEDTRAG